MTEFEIRSVPRQHTLVISTSTTPDTIGPAMGEALARAYDALATAGVAPAGPPFARYIEFGEKIEFEAGVPVAEPWTPDDGLLPSFIGGGDAAVAMHVGSYDTISETYEKLTDWVTEQGREPGGPMWETYLTGPDQEPDPAKWMTEVFVPVA